MVGVVLQHHGAISWAWRVAVAVICRRSHQGTDEHVQQLHLAAQCPSSHVQWFWLQRAWAETPVCLSFGRLTSMCLPLARVWWRDVAKGKAAPAKLITMEEWLRRDLGRQPQSGVLQLLGQTSKLRWATPSPSGVGLLHQQTLLRPPVFMSRNNASTIFQALDDSLGSLNSDARVETAKRCTRCLGVSVRRS